MKIKMKKYIITYYLRNKEKNYDSFYDTIKTNMPEYRHVLEDMWIVKSDRTADEITHLLLPHLYLGSPRADSIFVAEINAKNVEGLIGKSYWSFITDKDEEKDEEKMD